MYAAGVEYDPTNVLTELYLQELAFLCCMRDSSRSCAFYTTMMTSHLNHGHYIYPWLSAVEPWNRGTVEPWKHGCMEARKHGTTDAWKHGTTGGAR